MMIRAVDTTVRRGVAVLAVSGLLTAGLTAFGTSSAHSAPDTQCPTAVPVDQLTDGQVVNGLTVTKGTEPTTFTGSVEGVLEDGLAPGVDLIIADLHSSAIDADGIWEGMSGSPVYDANGGLIGAVAYSLGSGPSTIAGITPAADMAKMLDDANLADHDALPARVALPPTVARRLVTSDAATSAQASSGLKQLRLPVTVSGLGGARFAKVGPRLHAAGGGVLAGAAGPTSSEQIPIQAGGNMAAAYSYGTVTVAGLGTATMVCDVDGVQKVVGFGHPMDFSGPSTKSLHGARALLVQDDSNGGAFKLANLGAPVGTVDQDRIVGLRGIPGMNPAAASILTTSRVAGRQVQGTTEVNQQDVVPDLSFMHVAAVQDKALNRTGRGRATAAWTVRGTRANGDPFAVTLGDVFADPQDISSATADAVASDVFAIEDNDSEQVTISSVDVDSTLSDSYVAYQIAKVQVRVFGRWVTVSTNKATAVPAGAAVPVRLTLTSRTAAPKTVDVSLKVPKGAKNKLGQLHVVGYGQTADDGEDFVTSEDFGNFDEGYTFTGPSAPSPDKFPRLLASLKARPTQDQVDVSLKFRASGAAGARVKKVTRTTQVVSGEGRFPIVGR